MKWEIVAAFVVLLGIGLSGVPSAQALPGPAAGDCEVYRHQAVVAIAATIGAGDNEVWSTNPGCGVARSSTQVLSWTGHYSGPIITLFTTAGFSTIFASGCTIGTITQNTFMGAALSGSRAYANVTMTSNECHAVVRFSVYFNLLGTDIYRFESDLPINIRVEQTYPTMPAFPTSLNVTNSGNINGNQTLSGTISTQVTGNLSVAVSSWPSLNVAGNITVADDANGWATTIQAWPTLFSQTNITSWPALVAAISGNVTVTDDANGWATTIQAWPTLFSQTNITSWPALVAALSGNLTISDDADGWRNHIDGNLSLSGTLDTNTTVNIDTFDISNGTFNQTNLVPEIITIRNTGTDFYMPIFLWAFALFVFLRIAKLLAAVASTIGFMGSLATNLPEFQVIALVLLGIALWLEATAREKIYARWFTFKASKKGEGS